MPLYTCPVCGEKTEAADRAPVCPHLIEVERMEQEAAEQKAALEYLRKYGSKVIISRKDLVL